jgi:type II secretory pathway component GspD/PulD (secretin)
MTNTLVAYGTPEQLNQVEKLLNEVDVAQSQVMIEVALVEVSKSNNKIFQPFTSGNIQIGEFRLGVLNGNPLGILTGGSNFGSQGVKLPAFGFIFNNNDTKAKLLANPTIIALDGTSSSINITDSIVYFTSQIALGTGGSPPVVTVTSNTAEIGIQLQVTPHITNDGNITLALQPTVSQLIGIKSDPSGVATAPQIANRAFTIGSARVKDGQTLAIGGLLNDTRTESWDKIPGLASLPIVGAMFRSTTSAGNQSQRTELVVLVTPHILKEDVNNPYFDGEPHPASDKDPLVIHQHGRVGPPSSIPTGSAVMGAEGGELKIETGHYVINPPQDEKTKAVKTSRKAPKNDPFSSTPYTDYMKNIAAPAVEKSVTP